MYKVTLATYATPIQGDGYIGKSGNMSAVVSAVRAIFYALNERALNYEVLVEGVNSNNLDDLLFSVNGETIKSGSEDSGVQRKDYSFERSYALSPAVDLPTLTYILNSDIEDGIDEDIFHKGSPTLSDDSFRISKSPVGKTWMIRIFSHAVKYELQITDSPDYFERSVVLDIEVDDVEMDKEDRRAILEVATVLADRDFREDGRMDIYARNKGGKDFALFQVYELSGIDIQGSDMEMGLHAILADEHYSARDFLALNEDNLEEVVPRYLVIADKLQKNNESMRAKLALDIARHKFQVEQLKLESPDADAVLDVKAEAIDAIEKRVESYLSEHAGQVHENGQKSSVHRQIRSQIAEYESRMQGLVGFVEKSDELLDKLQGAGIVRNQGFDKLRFFSRAARSGINELALEAVVLLEEMREYR